MLRGMGVHAYPSPCRIWATSMHIVGGAPRASRESLVLPQQMSSAPAPSWSRQVRVALFFAPAYAVTATGVVLDGVAAVDDQGVAGDEGRCIGAQPQNRVGDILWAPQAAKGDLGR